VTARGHECPCGCGKIIDNVKFACPAGWAWLPEEHRRAIMAAWRAKDKARRDRDPAATQAAWRAHMLAMGAASRWFRAQRGATL